jgi:hypothetical protein
MSRMAWVPGLVLALAVIGGCATDPPPGPSTPASEVGPARPPGASDIEEDEPDDTDEDEPDETDEAE